MSEGLTVVQHPVLDDRLAVLRDVSTPHGAFRQALSEASAILAVESTRDLPTVAHTIKTPLEPAPGRRLEAEITIVPVLRAGLGMVDGFLRFMPDAAIGHLGMRRNEQTLQPEDYYESLPEGVQRSTVFVVDPMLATGGSAVAALGHLRRAGASDLRLVCLVAAPEGVAAVRAAHPEVPILAAVLDRGLDERGYIRPGLGDAGDRLFGTD
jgi:uracil phosphoribosyltransferase